MPSPERTAKYQRALLWLKTGVGRYAESTVGEPEEISVNWRWTRRDVKDPQGNRITIDAEVRVDDAVPIGSLMWLGALDDWNGSGSASSETGLMEVVFCSVPPDVKARFSEITLSLSRYKNALPS